MIQKLLVIRFSALGDIAMTVPVVASLCTQYPNTQVTMLTCKMGEKIYKAVLSAVPNLQVKGIDVKKDYAGIAGLNRLYHQLQEEEYDAVADLHDVLRTKWLNFRFLLNRTPKATIDKGRADKKALVAHKCMDQLKTSIERYREVFDVLGLPVRLDFTPTPLPLDKPLAANINIGIAPSAQHRGKIYPKEQMLQVIDLLLEARPDLHIYLFGGPDEKEELESWAARCSERITNTAGCQTLADDLRLMSHLDCILTMDSANMHMASLVGCRAVSIWGATDVKAGFYGYHQDPNDAIALPLECRPCSIYGNKPCRFEDFRCLTGIHPSTIVKRILT